MALTLILLSLAALFYWAARRAPTPGTQIRLRGGIVVLLGLAGVAAYFAWRAGQTLGELATLIDDPVPEIADVNYVPTARELAGAELFSCCYSHVESSCGWRGPS